MQQTAVIVVTLACPVENELAVKHYLNNATKRLGYEVIHTTVEYEDRERKE